MANSGPMSTLRRVVPGDAISASLDRSPPAAATSAFSTDERTSEPSTRPGCSMPIPRSASTAWATIAAEKLDAALERLGVRGAVLVGDDHRLGAHLDDERLRDRQHGAGRGDRAPRLAQPHQVDARAGERHRGRDRERDRARRERGSEHRGAESGRRVQHELTGLPGAGRREARDEIRAGRRAPPAATSSLRSMIAGHVEHRHAGQHRVDAIACGLRHGVDARRSRGPRRRAPHR